MKKSEENYRSVQFVPVSNGALAFFHRPSKAGLNILKQIGCTCVITLQSESEQAQEITGFCRQLDLKHVWVPLQGANKKLLESNKTSTLLKSALTQAQDLLSSGHHILVHCAAGIHRTGLFSYALLRISGYDESSTLETIKQVRLVTFERCGKFRFELAENLAQQILNENFDVECLELSMMKNCKKVDNPLVFIKFTLSHIGELRFNCVVTESDLKSYALGPSVNISINFEYLKERLGEDWLFMRQTQFLTGGISKSFKGLENDLKVFFQKTFSCRQVTWASPFVESDLVFFVNFCPELVKNFGERSVKTGDGYRDTIFEEILEFRQKFFGGFDGGEVGAE
jgi:protein-tyrosine phosphatase